MARAPPRKEANLSKHLLQMKFMQRSAIRNQKEEYEAHQQKYVDDEHWRLDLQELKERESQYVMEPSFVYCELLQYGRMSFRNFNPEVEKLMVSVNRDNSLSLAEANEKMMGVDDEEMAERYQNLIGSVRNKFTKKRQRTKANSSDEEEEERYAAPSPTDKVKRGKYSRNDRKKSKSPGWDGSKGKKGGRYY